MMLPMALIQNICGAPVVINPDGDQLHGGDRADLPMTRELEIAIGAGRVMVVEAEDKPTPPAPAPGGGKGEQKEPS